MQDRKLAEGMRRYDLEDMVLPLISVDEYESKVDPEAIVFGFYVKDHAAATDLNRFLQKSPVEMLDTDVSPAPDQRGYFMVFVEMANDDQAPKGIVVMCDEIKNLTDITKWQMRIRGQEKILPLDAGIIAKHLVRERRVNKQRQEEGVLEYLEPSKLRSARLVEDELHLNESESVKLIDFGDIDYLLDAYDLRQRPLATDSYSRWQCQRVGNLLGEGWNVDLIGDYQMISHADSDRSILVKSTS